MKTWKARVVNGRLVMDEATELPDGMEIEVAPVDEGDDLTDEERKELHTALSRGCKSIEEGRVFGARQVLDELKTGRCEPR